MISLEQAVGTVLESFEAKAAAETRNAIRREILRSVTPLVAELRKLADRSECTGCMASGMVPASFVEDVADKLDEALCKVWQR